MVIYILGTILFVTIAIIGVGAGCCCVIAGKADIIAEEMLLKESKY